MEHQLLIASTLCYFGAFLRTLLHLRDRVFHRSPFHFALILLGFLLQTAFLFVRGRAIGRCPITNLFEVLTFLAWSIALIYLVVGPAYRLSLMGAFTAPLVFLLQGVALISRLDVPPLGRLRPNTWLELHASVSMIAYGAFALAGVAGVMYLVQERQLKTHVLQSIFYQLPPLPNLFAAMSRLLSLGFILYTAGIVSGFFTGEPLPALKMSLALAVWLLYGAILVSRYFRSVTPRRIAALSVLAFAGALSLLWSIEFVSHRA